MYVCKTAWQMKHNECVIYFYGWKCNSASSDDEDADVCDSDNNDECMIIQFVRINQNTSEMRVIIYCLSQNIAVCINLQGITLMCPYFHSLLQGLPLDLQIQWQ